MYIDLGTPFYMNIVRMGRYKKRWNPAWGRYVGSTNRNDAVRLRRKLYAKCKESRSAWTKKDFKTICIQGGI